MTRTRENWLPQQEQALMLLWRKGYNRFEIASALDRTPGAITKKVRVLRNQDYVLPSQQGRRTDLAR